MLPSNTRFSGNSYVPEYFRRLLNYPQMDLEYTTWQMLYFCIDPLTAYRATLYHKQTKNQWARDDPCFVAILTYFLAISSLSYAVAFQADGIIEILKTMVSAILFDFIFVGVVIATIGWIVSNKYFRVQSSSHTTEQKVEWMYAFDVHCNSFFPVFVVLYALQFFFLPFLLSESFLATFIANSMYSVTFCYYFYVTFLGYQVLPFLQNVVFFLYPIGGLMVLYLFSLLSNFNMCIFVMNSYFGQDAVYTSSPTQSISVNATAVGY